MSTAQEILRWLEGRPKWQAVALRMLSETENLSAEQVATLAALAANECGLEVPFGTPEDNHPINEKHLGLLRGTSSDVAILSLAEVERVNRLAPDQVLIFAADGLTVVYGDNGAGKTGYARVLKRTCSAREAGAPILANVFAESPHEPAAATLAFMIDGETREVRWSDGPQVSPVLPEVSFFDLSCSEVQVAEDNEVTFTPFGLDLIGRLASACDAVSARLSAYAGEVLASAPPVEAQEEHQGTSVAAILARLTAATDTAELHRSVPLTEPEEEERQSLREAVKADPALIIASCTNQLRPVKELEVALAAFADVLSATRVSEAERLILEVETSKEAAKLAADKLFAGAPLDGVGSDVWKALWSAAGAYSKEMAYPGEDFPFVGEGSACPLCQQPLEEEAKTRLSGFEEYVQAATEQALRQQERLLSEFQKAFRADVETGLRRQAHVEAIPFEGLREGLLDLFSRMEALLEIPDRDTSLSLCQRVGGLLEEVRAYGTELEEKKRSAEDRMDPERASATRRRLSDLEARQWLGQRLEAVEARVSALRATEKIEQAKMGCGTKAVSMFVGHLAETEVTARLADAFSEELWALGVTRIPVSLQGAGTRKGVSKHRMAIEGVTCNAPLPEVLSEGEQKAIALAGFMAEVRTRGDRSAVVFDDPVTSLDHRWRRRVARRLAGESLSRQVIVFTHDIVFLVLLQEELDRIGEELSAVTLYDSVNGAGIARSGLPWLGQNTKTRVKALKAVAQRADAEEKDPERYEPYIKELYGMLREAWERAIEEVLLNGAVQRFGRSVETKRLRKLVDDIRPDDYERIEAAMSKCSTVLRGHDDAPELNEPLPSPEEAKEDVAALEAWVSELRERGRS